MGDCMLESVKLVLSNRKYLSIWLISTLFFLGVYVFLPVYLTPGNDLDFFLKITPYWQILLLAALAMLMGLVISMQLYIKNALGSGIGAVKIAASGAITSLSSIISGVFSTATCSSCVAAVLGFLGLGSSFAFLLLQYQWQVAALGFIIAIASVHFSARRISSNACKVRKTGVRIATN